MHAVPYSLFYFAFFFLTAAQIAFVPIYCNNLGFTALQVALVTGTSNAGVLVGGPLSMAIARRYFSASLLLVIFVLLSALGAIGLLFAETFPPFLSLMMVTATCTAAAITLVDYEAAHVRNVDGSSFENIRLWGSIGFIVASATLGIITDVLGDPAIIPAYVSFLVFVAIASFIAAPHLARTPYHDGNSGVNSTAPFPWRTFLPFLVVLFLQWASHSTLYVFLSIHLKHLGWSGSAISAAWNWGVICEIGIFMVFGRISTRFRVLTLLKLSLFVTVLRWLMLALTTSPVLIFFAQGLHAVTFGAFFLSSLRLLRELLPAQHTSKGQGLMAFAGTGAGLIFGRVIVGIAGSVLGGAEGVPQMFLLSAILALLAFFTTFFIVNKKETGGVP